MHEGRDKSVEEGIRRGRDGWSAPIMRDSIIVGHRHRFDNRLLYAACYGQKPLPL